MSDSGSHRSLEADMAAWGRVITLEARGRTSGKTRRVHVGFVEEADGSLMVAASSRSTHWALNLEADPSCVVEREGVRRHCQAEALRGPDHHGVVQALILKYGTPAEQLGAGPAFRLRSVSADG
jgi:deazaflavin-dependent oxidoreductase (nitroreductase family)